MSAMDLARADFCGTDLGAHDALDGADGWPRRNVTCDSTGESYLLQCTNATGSVSFTCPNEYTSSRCSWWDADSGSWSSEGCAWWYDNVDAGYSVCNCTHLTSFTAQIEKKLTNQASTFTDTMSGTSELTVHDFEKSKVGLFDLHTTDYAHHLSPNPIRVF